MSTTLKALQLDLAKTQRRLEQYEDMALDPEVPDTTRAHAQSMINYYKEEVRKVRDVVVKNFTVGPDTPQDPPRAEYRPTGAQLGEASPSM